MAGNTQLHLSDYYSELWEKLQVGDFLHQQFAVPNQISVQSIKKTTKNANRANLSPAEVITEMVRHEMAYA
jgi:hypothetical protein